ncbi:MAG: hypothetical protein K6F34_00140 [Lachnospiraceae bacterium]|nr:hypothetical protein [Lachnospiraceae bacterium]
MNKKSFRNIRTISLSLCVSLCLTGCSGRAQIEDKERTANTPTPAISVSEVPVVTSSPSPILSASPYNINDHIKSAVYTDDAGNAIEATEYYQYSTVPSYPSVVFPASWKITDAVFNQSYGDMWSLDNITVQPVSGVSITYGYNKQLESRFDRPDIRYLAQIAFCYSEPEKFEYITDINAKYIAEADHTLIGIYTEDVLGYNESLYVYCEAYGNYDISSLINTLIFYAHDGEIDRAEDLKRMLAGFDASVPDIPAVRTVKANNEETREWIKSHILNDSSIKLTSFDRDPSEAAAALESQLRELRCIPHGYFFWDGQMTAEEIKQYIENNK